MLRRRRPRMAEKKEAEKVTTMVLKVDLQCPCCYKKVKKTLCKFPQIRDQIYDEKGNTVTITVVCCSPEKIQDKLCCKGGKAIKSVTIKDNKPKPADKPKDAAAAGGDKPKDAGGAKPKDVGAVKPKDAGGDKPKDAGAVKPKDAGGDKPKDVGAAKPKDAGGDKPKEAQKPKDAGGDKPKAGGDKPKDAGGDKPKDKPKEGGDKPKEGGGDKPKDAKPDGAKAAAPGPNPPMMFQSGPVNGFPMVYQGPGQGYYEGHYGVPGYQFGTPPPPQPSYEGYNPGYGYGGYDHGRGHGPHVSVTRADFYFSDENPQACSIM